MESVEIREMLPASLGASLNESTIVLWKRIYAYIQKNGYADAVDNKEFIDHVNELKPISRQTIQMHLRRMTEAGLIAGHEMRIRQTKKDPFASLLGPLFGANHPPRRFLRYTLRGHNPSTRYEEPERERARRDMLKEYEAKKRADGPSSIESEFDLDDLEQWLEDNDNGKNVISATKLRKSRDLVDKACALLQKRQNHLQRLLGAITARAGSKSVSK